MSEFGHEQEERPVELSEDLPEGEEISPADVAERIDQDPDEQRNRHDPVWDDEEHDD